MLIRPLRGLVRRLPRPPARLRLPLHLALLGLFVPLLGGTGLLVALLMSQRMEAMATQAAERELALRLDAVRASWRSLVNVRLMAVQLQLLQQQAPLLGRAERDRWLPALPVFQGLLAEAPVLRAVYLADRSGSLFRVSRTGAGSAGGGAAAPVLPPASRYLVEGIVRGSGAPRLFAEAFDADLRSLGAVPVPAALRGYDPRQRPWYRLALQGQGRPMLSPPQPLPLSGGVGITVSRRFEAGAGAAGLSLRADDLERVLRRFQLTPGSQLALVDPAGRLLLSTTASQAAEHLRPLGQVVAPPLRALASRLPALQAGVKDSPQLIRYRVGREPWFVAAGTLRNVIDGSTNTLLLTVPERELMAGAHQALRHAQLITLVVVLLSLPLAGLLARVLSSALRRLSLQAEAIRRFRFDDLPAPATHLREVDELATTLGIMRGTIRTFLQSSSALGSEPDVERLLQRLLDDAITSSGASGGDLLRAEDVDADTPLRSEDPCQLRLPLRSRDGALQGLLQLRFPEPPDPGRVAFCTALSGTAAVALETRSLIAAQKALFEAFIRIIAAAIDAKSPYTGGHCERVPELARMLATAACEADSGPFAAFQLSETEWEALHIGSWLHDCGKVTTPEYVVDKATKLETLYDRIHEVRMRFELLKCAAERDHWRAVADGGDPEALRPGLEATWAALDDDFAFVASCNLGGEVMDPKHIERLHRIAGRRWLRTLDDRLGMSHDERRRCADEPELPLPCWEPLLADRSRHRIPRAEEHRIPADNPWGFTMDAPELLADRGELRNLCIARGTLTEEERYTINQHIIHTIRMLEALPYPAHLRQVPEIAGGHHERIDGQGYPRSLTGEQMSPLARMMAIADVFEALTAADRPYKSGKPLSVALGIMARMAREGHLDADLFALFVRAGVHRRYAERFLSPEAVDAVDEEALLRG